MQSAGVSYGAPVPDLQAPSLRVARSVRAVAQTHGDDVWPRYVAEVAAAGDDQLRRWVDRLRAESAGAVLDSTGERVPRTHYWWVEDADYLGRLTLYHHLTPALERDGGHISYYVAPPHRGRGHAVAMLQAVLPRAAALGLPRVLVVCDRDNHASRRVIQRAGGQPAAPHAGTLRYWIPTG
jgi:predicted acetyltransferase